MDSTSSSSSSPSTTTPSDNAPTRSDNQQVAAGEGIVREPQQQLVEIPAFELLTE